MEILQVNNMLGAHKMVTISISDFYVKRLPIDLVKYVEDAYTFIDGNSELKKIARLKKEPYKTFIEELLPFSKFCKWKYGNRSDVLCSLVPGTTGRDAIITFCDKNIEHSVEITWPIDGLREFLHAKQLNEEGITDVMMWSGIESNYVEIQRIIEGAQKKSIKDYRFSGGSSLLIVFEKEPFFLSDNPKHNEILDELIIKLKKISYLVDNVYLLIVPGEEFVIIKST